MSARIRKSTACFAEAVDIDGVIVDDLVVIVTDVLAGHCLVFGRPLEGKQSKAMTKAPKPAKPAQQTESQSRAYPTSSPYRLQHYSQSRPKPPRHPKPTNCRSQLRSSTFAVERRAEAETNTEQQRVPTENEKCKEEDGHTHQGTPADVDTQQEQTDDCAGTAIRDVACQVDIKENSSQKTHNKAVDNEPAYHVIEFLPDVIPLRISSARRPARGSEVETSPRLVKKSLSPMPDIIVSGLPNYSNLRRSRYAISLSQEHLNSANISKSRESLTSAVSKSWSSFPAQSFYTSSAAKKSLRDWANQLQHIKVKRRTEPQPEPQLDGHMSAMTTDCPSVKGSSDPCQRNYVSVHEDQTECNHPASNDLTVEGDNVIECESNVHAGDDVFHTMTPTGFEVEEVSKNKKENDAVNDKTAHVPTVSVDEESTDGGSFDEGEVDEGEEGTTFSNELTLDDDQIDPTDIPFTQENGEGTLSEDFENFSEQEKWDVRDNDEDMKKSKEMDDDTRCVPRVSLLRSLTSRKGFSYKVFIRTGEAGTRGMVCLILTGEHGRSEEIYLTRSLTCVEKFQRSQTDVFHIQLNKHLGQMHSVYVTHLTPKFFQSRWKLEFVHIVDEHVNVQYSFSQSVWFGRPKGLLSSFCREGAAFTMSCAMTHCQSGAVVETLPGKRPVNGQSCPQLQHASLWVMALFEGADKSHDGLLSQNEIVKMAKAQNMSSFAVNEFSKSVKNSKNNSLNEESFAQIWYNVSQRPEVVEIFARLSDDGYHLSAENWTDFQAEQNQANGMSFSDVLEEYCSEDCCLSERLTFEGFLEYLLGPEGSICNFEERVEDDMTQPLSHYFIASSHNTYLVADQVKGPSSEECYVRVLRSGSRCVELDTWDFEGQPVITHGHTLTQRLSLQKVLEAIRDNAFYTSPYPLILSFENHCSVVIQKKIANLLREIFGDRLYTLPPDDSVGYLPSPFDLRGKILIKNKKNVDFTGTPSVMSSPETVSSRNAHQQRLQSWPQGERPRRSSSPSHSTRTAVSSGFHVRSISQPMAIVAGDQTPVISGADLFERLNSADVAARTDSSLSPSFHHSFQIPELTGINEANGEDNVTADTSNHDMSTGQSHASLNESVFGSASVEDGHCTETFNTSASSTLSPVQGVDEVTEQQSDVLMTQSISRHHQTNRMSKKVSKIAMELSDLVNIIQPVPMKQGLQEGKYWEMSSINENMLKKLVSASTSSVISHTKRQLLRIYPGGRRLDSSNYNPVEAWNVGCQMVALNYQTPGLMMDLNNALFSQNGMAGYVLKPFFQRQLKTDGMLTEDSGLGVREPACTVTLRVMSGQHLPHPDNASPTGEAVSPSVLVEVWGVAADRHDFRTRQVQQNGFRPYWNETTTFTVSCPELAFLRFCVLDGGKADRFIGQFTLPFMRLQTGYRHVHLLCQTGHTLPGATLFVHTTVNRQI